MGLDQRSGGDKPLVLHVITGLGHGGAEAMLAKLVRRSHRFEHVIASLSAVGPIGEEMRRARVRVEALQMAFGPNAVRGPIRGATLARELRPHIIQGWMNHGNLAATLLRPLAGRNVPLVWNIRQSLTAVQKDNWRTRAIIALNARLSGQAEAIIYNSSAGAADHERVGYSPENRLIIPNGFDIDTFRPSDDDASRFRRTLGVPEGEILVGLVARLNHWKNHAAFFQAASLLIDRGAPVRFLFAGEGTAADNPELRGLVRDARLWNYSHFLGLRPDLPVVTAALDIACNVSHGEGFANTVGEAMACAVPCVVTDAGDNVAIVGDAGVVAEDTGPKAIAEALALTISMGPTARRQMGERGRRRILQYYSLDSVVNRYEAMYENLLAK